MSKPDFEIGRRPLLRCGLGAAAALGLARAGWTRSVFRGRQDLATRRVVLIAFAGGVRSRETFGAPANIPNLVQLASEGVLYPRARTANLGHFGASLSIFTGVDEPRGIRENAPGFEPTLFEYLRKDLGLSAGDLWIATSGGAQQVNYAASVHPDYGPRFGATTVDGEGVFNRDMRRVLTKLGKPLVFPDEEQAWVDGMRAALDGQPARGESLARVEKYILDELARDTTELSGPSASDQKALRLARNVLSIFQPAVTAVVLRDADIAHRSFSGYVDTIRRNDAALGEIMQAIRSDEQLASSTSVFVVPEFGRDSDLNTRRGLDHGDGSSDLNYVSCVAWGPDFARGKVVNDDVRVIDVAPTICELFGAKAPHARGRRLRGLFA